MEKKIELYETAEVSSEQIVEIATLFAKDDNSIMIVPDEIHRVKIRIALCLACDDVNKSKLTDIFISNYDSFSNGEKNIYVIANDNAPIVTLINYALTHKLNLYVFYGVKQLPLTSLAPHSLDSITDLLNTTEVILGVLGTGITKKLIDRFIEATIKETDKSVVFLTCEDTTESIINRVRGQSSNFENSFVSTVSTYSIHKLTNIFDLKSILLKYLSKKDCILFLDSPSSIYIPTDKTLSTFLKEMKDELESITSHNLRIIYTENVNFTVNSGK